LYRALVPRSAARRVAGPATDSIARLLGLSEAARSAAMQDVVKTELAKSLLLLPGSDMPFDKPFRELGVDSLMAVDLAKRLSSYVGLRLPVSLMWEFPTVSAVSNSILGMLAKGQGLATSSAALHPAEPHDAPATGGTSPRRVPGAKEEEPSASPAAVPGVFIGPGGVEERLDIGPLMSKYLNRGFTDEGLRMLRLSHDQQRRTSTAVWEVTKPYPNVEEFHLAALMAYLMVQQTGVVHTLLELGFREKKHEVWMQESQLWFLRAIRQTTDLVCTYETVESTVEAIASEEGRATDRYASLFRADINGVFSVKGRGLVDIPRDELPPHAGNGAATSAR
jgi:acyl carrier protein